MDHHPEHGQDDSAAMAELLELEADVMGSYHREVAAWLRRLAANQPRRRIIDLGSGPGVGTIALAQFFAGTQVVAIDASALMLERVRHKALSLGLPDRIRTLHADLDEGLPDVGPVDLAWASLSLHHLKNPDRILHDLTTAMSPGGLVAVAEMASPVRVLPDDIGLGRPGLEDRLQAATAKHRHESMPNLDSDWGVRLEQSGFTLATRRRFTTDLKPPLPANARVYASRWLQRIRPDADNSLDTEDLVALDTLLHSDGPDNLLRRDDLAIHTSRDVWVAQRFPSDAPR
jgi:SAM-dependent methyltransferase